MIDRERFTPARHACREPDRSAVPPLGGSKRACKANRLTPREPECLSLQSPILASACNKWK